ncbi:sugar transferase [Leptolyngbya sp. PCC 6406]|uniref:sugar transferase n=1 Tax=Leptolyngbya sp. PCC 6406 TaxID=1173264 RepID=UPI0002AC52C9|nr:sugar transferase [Leptolyngbya sp. PCC 6406]
MSLDEEFLPMQPLCSDRHCVLPIPPVFTVTEAMAFRQTCQTLLDQRPQLEKLFLDFSQTTFVDSSGIGALVICRRLCEQHKTALRLEKVGPQVMMTLAMTDLDKVFTIATAAAPPPKVIIQAPDKPIPTPHPSVTSRTKRAMDVVGAIVGLGLTTVLAIPIAIAIKLDDGGPILFGQIRCSWMGRRFRIWKFRSMVVHAEGMKHQVENQVEGPLFKNENDPRITRVGRFLRKTSLDELPQFWNVLKGDMSLVGTRPPTVDELDHYEVMEWQRLDVKPGMTGEWQVNGRSSIKRFEDVIRLDLKYQENWSLLYDIKLILKTVLVLFTHRSGAA